MPRSRLLFPLALTTLLACQGDIIADPETDTDTGISTTASTASTAEPTSTSTASTTDPTTNPTTDPTTNPTMDPTTTASTGENTTGTPDPVCGDDVQDVGEECDNGAQNGDDQACTAACEINVCGDGKQGPGEGCDDGNLVDGDGCSAQCSSPDCGDGALDPGEACDDRNADNTDACTDACTAAVCGDNFIQPSNAEACDNGAQNGDDQACTAGCVINVCGDGKQGPGEGCDDGNVLDGDGCTSQCSLPDCGDGLLAVGEACDDGNDDNTDACTDTCTPATCGDGFIQPSNAEACDNGAQNGDDQACTAECELNVCGDGKQGPGEGCDDGNVLDGDGCTSQCSLPDCGDGLPGVGEACDDGNDINTDACTAACTAATCGDGFIQPSNGETCDNGVDNNDNAPCTHLCLSAVCGDGYLLTDVEECDDGMQNGDDKACTAGCLLNVCGDGKLGPGELCDDGNLVDGDGCSAECEGLQAATLQLNFSQIKQFDFSWAPANGATHYQLLERPTVNDPYTQLGGNIVGTSVSHTMPLHLRFGARYILRTCDGNGCTSSAPVDVVNSMATAVGYFKASNTQSGDVFGELIALSADGNTLAVGAQGEDSAATGINGDQANNAAVDAGAVYVFVRAGKAWSQQAYVKASNTGSGDGFGVNLALSANGDTLAVAAFQEDSAATGIDGDQDSNTAPTSGAVYVFARANSVWSQQAYVKASNAEANDAFGIGVALSGDGDTLAVGAQGEDSAATGVGGDQASNAVTGSGATYVFVRTNNSWSQQAYIKASNTGSGDFFGNRLALSGNGDTLAVAARDENSAATGINGNQADNTAVGAGAAYVFVRVNNAWSQQAYVKASNAQKSDHFGWSIALSTNGNTLAVGANFEDSAATGINGDQANNAAADSGAAYVFARVNNAWSQQAYVKASNTGAADYFAYTLALSGDGDTLAVKASDDSPAVGVGGNQGNGAESAGAIYVYVRANTTWSQRAFVKASNTASIDGFGRGIALSTDGGLLVGAAFLEDSAATGVNGDQANNAANNAGAVYMY
ncbi:DUF4215 domain-containing protein [Nannocystis sp.]|uniref:DUF4215 domain-containing protein n=1 Tax=Nannocystis sp. TaxID=1962667 RepID=UPI0025DB527A|nr:DUF4215 domain-containing protein [Nannocystis sp.]